MFCDFCVDNNSVALEFQARKVALEQLRDEYEALRTRHEREKSENRALILQSKTAYREYVCLVSEIYVQSYFSGAQNVDVRCANAQNSEVETKEV